MSAKARQLQSSTSGCGQGKGNKVQATMKNSSIDTQSASLNLSGTSVWTEQALRERVQQDTLPVAPVTKRSMKGILVVGVLLALFAALVTALLLAVSRPHAVIKKERAVPVSVATASTSNVPLKIRSIGNVAPYSVVNITAQVSGQLTHVYFKQGQLVRKGDLLFQIDPRPYKAALDQAEGNIAKDRAQIEVAQANLAKDRAQVGQLEAGMKKDEAQLTFAGTENKRYAELVAEGAVSHEQSDQMTNNASQAAATVQADKKAIENAQAVVQADLAQIDTARGTLSADEGAVENARIQLGWTQIRSPIDGRTGSLNVYEGNNVTANSSTSLVTINQIQPIYVTVTVPEQYLADVRRAQKNGTLAMQALIEGSAADAVDGTISFIENTVNTSTGTILLRGSFANASQHLYPGQFVDVNLTIPSAGKNVVVPQRAIQMTQQGASVYVVRPDGRVAIVPVQIGQSSGETTAVTGGLASGATVVVDGQMNLSSGSLVKIQRGGTD